MKIKQLGIVSGVALATLVTASAAQAALVVVPPGLNPGDQYRLVFVTDGTRDATSTNINDYNNFVTTQVTGSALEGTQQGLSRSSPGRSRPRELGRSRLHVSSTRERASQRGEYENFLIPQTPSDVTTRHSAGGLGRRRTPVRTTYQPPSDARPCQ